MIDMKFITGAEKLKQYAKELGRGEDLYILKLDVTKDESVNDAKVTFNFKTSNKRIVFVIV